LICIAILFNTSALIDSKHISNVLYNVKIFNFKSIFFLFFYSDIYIYISVSINILSHTTVFNCDNNNKKYLSSIKSTQEWEDNHFWFNKWRNFPTPSANYFICANDTILYMIYMIFLTRLLQKWGFGWQSLNTFCSFPLHASPQETSSTAAPPPMNVRSPNAEGSPAKPAASWSVWPSAWCEKVSDRNGSGRGSKCTFYWFSDCISHYLPFWENLLVSLRRKKSRTGLE